MGSLLQELLSADNEDKIWVSTNKLSKMQSLDLFKLVNEKVMITFNTEDCKKTFMDKNILMGPEKCTDPYIRLELMCFKYIFRNQYSDYAYAEMADSVFNAIHEIDVDNYISSIKGSSFNSHAVIHMLENATNTVKKNQSVFQVECYAKLLDLLAQAILIDINCIVFEKISDVMLVFTDILHVVEIYMEIREKMLDVNLTNHPLQTTSTRSALTAISNWIPILKPKLLHSKIKSSHWSGMISNIENLRDCMVVDFKPLCPELSLQMFLIKKEDVVFYADSPEEPNDITNGITQISISEKSTDEPHVPHHTFKSVSKDIEKHVCTMIRTLTFPIRGIAYFDADEESGSSDEDEDYDFESDEDTSDEN